MQLPKKESDESKSQGVYRKYCRAGYWHVNSAVYDHTQDRHIHVSVSYPSVNVYDHDRGTHVTGTLPDLYDYGLCRHVSLNLNGTQFSGYDPGSGRHYSGQINGSAVVIYDHDSGQHYLWPLTRIDPLKLLPNSTTVLVG